MESSVEGTLICPYCAQQVSMVFDKYHGSQTYIEDCEVCCHPIQVNYRFDQNDEIHIEATKAQ